MTKLPEDTKRLIDSIAQIRGLLNVMTTEQIMDEHSTWLRMRLSHLADDPSVHPEARRVIAEVLKEERQ